MNSLVIGLGEVGSAIYNVLHDHYGDSVYKRDIGDVETRCSIDILHICFPYSENFEESVKNYQEEYLPKLTIIHSTVPIGTSDRLKAVHSPIRGVHPNLESGIRTFVKYFGGDQACEAAKYFEPICNVFMTGNTRDTEALKLWSTTQYFVMIDLEKEMHKYCRDNDLDFDLIYNHANKTYNDGYKTLAMGNVARPTVNHVSGAIGGHCVLPNAKLLNTPFTNNLLTRNESYE